METAIAEEPAAPVDAATLDDLRCAVGDALDIIVESFLSDAERLLAEIATALPAGDTVAIKDCAHQLKSSSASVGALTLSALMQELEALGAEGTVAGAPALLDQANADFKRVRAYFSAPA